MDHTASPQMSSSNLSTRAVSGALTVAAISMLWLLAARPAQAQTESVLYNFFTANGDGAYPYASLVFDHAGNLYGTNTYCDNGYFCGTAFELTSNGRGGWNETVIYTFCSAPNCADGGGPRSNLVFDNAGNLYGTTYGGGANGTGTVFELTPASGGTWNETVLYSFCSQSNCTDGTSPQSGVVFDNAGNLYGSAGGVVFELSPSGGGWTEKSIYNSDGESITGITRDATGNIFCASFSTVFELSPDNSGGWTPIVIHTFAGGVDSAGATGTPVLDTAGNLYGTTAEGPFGGTVYKVSPGPGGAWSEQVIHSFGGPGDGFEPLAGVTLDSAGNIYGTTASGGTYYAGTVFELVAPTAVGGSYQEKILCDFDDWDGFAPIGGVVLDTAGNLYGTTSEGGSRYGQGNDNNGYGVAFEVARPGAKPNTSTTLVSNLNPSLYGQKITLTASVTTSGKTPPTGKVSFTWGNGLYSLGSATLNSSGVATLTRTANAGSYPIVAIYSGDANNLASSSFVLNQVVEQTTSAATLTSSSNPSPQGESVTFTAKITSPTTTPTGPVTFTAGKTSLGSVELSQGKATFTTSTLPVGTNTITVTYPWNSDIAESSASVAQVVQQ